MRPAAGQPKASEVGELPVDARPANIVWERNRIDQLREDT